MISEELKQLAEKHGVYLVESGTVDFTIPDTNNLLLSDYIKLLSETQAGHPNKTLYIDPHGVWIFYDEDRTEADIRQDIDIKIKRDLNRLAELKSLYEGGK